MREIALLVAFISFLMCLWLALQLIEQSNMMVWWLIIYLVSSVAVYHLAEKDKK